MELLIICVYLILLIAQIGLLATKRNRAAILLSLLSVIAAVILTVVFDRLPGTGMMPGLTWFSEVIFSMAATAVYGVMLVVSLLLRFFKKDK